MASIASSGTDGRGRPVVLVPGGPHDGVESLVARGDPGQTLLEHARDARVLVLGNSRRGGVAGALPGSVGLHCAHHSTCPLVLVPSA